MKIIVYGARTDEIPFMQAWQAAHEDDLEIHTETLNEETVRWAEGFDGINSFQATPYSAAMFKQMGAMGIHYLAIRNVGTDNIDFQAAAKAGVHISNVPAYSPNAIAEFAVTLSLYLLRRFGAVSRQMHAEDFDGTAKFMGRELAQCTVGIVGAGRIGQAAVRLFNGFGSRVLIYDPHPIPDPPLQGEYMDLPSLLAQSDVVSLHIPGIPENHHFIDAEALRQMKQDALIINTARGNLVDSEALLEELTNGHLGGAGIDVYEHESEALLAANRTGKFSDPLWDQLEALDNVVITPHIAYHTQTAVKNMVDYSLANLLDFLHTGHADTEVFPY